MATAAESADQTLYLVVSTYIHSDRVLHTNEDCHYIENADNYRETTREQHPGLPICQSCSGEREYFKGGPGSFYERLRQLRSHDSPDKELDHTDVEDLREAYENSITIAEAAEQFPVCYDTVYKRLVEEGIHVPKSSNNGGETA